MEKWQKFISDHQRISVIDEDSIRINNIAYDEHLNWYDDIVTKLDKGYQIDTYLNETNVKVETHLENNLYDYLNY